MEMSPVSETAAEEVAPVETSSKKKNKKKDVEKKDVKNKDAEKKKSKADEPHGRHVHSPHASAKKADAASRKKSLKPSAGEKKIVRKTHGKASRDDAPAPAADGMKKRHHRFHAGTVALRQIKKYQKSTELLMRKMPFARLVREIAQQEMPSNDLRFQGKALEALQEAAEAFLVGAFDRAGVYANHAGRITVNPDDLKLAIAD